jgi:hypothetical protein
MLMVKRFVVIGLCAGMLATSQAKAAEPSIAVGANVQVSTANAGRQHLEVVAATDPDDPRHLMACSHIAGSEPSFDLKSVIYQSHDGGQSWRQATVLNDYDPWCAFGQRGLAYFGGYSFYRSTDGATHWTKLHAMAPSMQTDRPYVTVDNVSRQHRGTVYYNLWFAETSFDKPDANLSWSSGDLTNGFMVYHSDDHGRTFSEPILRTAIGGGRVFNIAPGTVAPNGTFMFIFNELMSYRDLGTQHANQPNAWIKAVTSYDGGKTLQPASIVSTATLNTSDQRSYVTNLATAADTSAGPFRNHLYAVWQDFHAGRSRISLAYTADRGKTWSQPVVVDDDSSRADTKEGPNDFMPAVAVNRNGIVGVLWYDRRDDPDDLGWHVRFSASNDGGNSFFPSVRVSSQPMAITASDTLRLIGGYDRVGLSPGASGHTAGLAAGSDGVFHAVWVDNRTRVPQLWTAPITVDAWAVRNGSPELASLRDVSSSTQLGFANGIYQSSTGELSVDLYVKNTSTKVLRGPLKMRVSRISSDIGDISNVMIDGTNAGPGTILDIAATGLGVGKVSQPLHIVAHVNWHLDTHSDEAPSSLDSILAIDSKRFAPK